MGDGSGQLRRVFDAVADEYQDARPEYPDELFDTLVTVTGLRPGDRLLEVGCASGKATLPLARRGFRITCVELGPALVAAARINLADFDDVDVVEGAFETWKPPRDERFDLVFAATAWHWLDPAIRYAQTWRLLRPGGHLAIWSAVHVMPVGGDPFFVEIQDVYDEISEGLPEVAVWPGPRPGGLCDDRQEIERTRLFENVIVRHFDWEVIYDAEGYLRLLDTFSGHIAMHDWQRDRLYGEIRRRLAERPDGRLRRHWGAVLQVARRADTSAVS
ncbi:MAG: class I SAM-dependent methyltransferase [Actinomycetota bacterium]|nr:class I SAM-dependent methyltransferase [Actinomycetota bacterium]